MLISFQFDARIHFPCACVSTLRDFSTSYLGLESSSGNSTGRARVSLLKLSSAGRKGGGQKRGRRRASAALLPGCAEWLHSTCAGGRVEPTDLLKHEQCFGVLTGWMAPQLKCRSWLRLLKHFSIANVLNSETPVAFFFCMKQFLSLA